MKGESNTDTEKNMTAREAINAYYREWRKKNPEKVKAAQERYWTKKAAERTAKMTADENTEE